MIWLSWRRQRTETVIAAGMLLLLAALLVPTGIQMANAYHHDGLAACLGRDNPGFSCSNALNSFRQRFDSIGNLIAWLTLVPGLVGVLLAAPFVLELEQGTYRLAWTQSVSRRQWIGVKLTLAICAAVISALVFTQLVTWWRTPLVQLDGRMDGSVYDSEGIVVIGYTLFALGLAAAIGVVWRRAVPALVVGFAGYFAARLFVDTWLRQRLLSPLSATWHFNGSGPAGFAHGWVLNQYPSDASGHAVRLPLGLCARGAPIGQKKLFDPSGLSDCLARHGYYMHAVYHPASSFWPLQIRETVLFAGVGLVLLGFTAWWTNRRAA
jgi:hypothetical protein